MQVRIVVCAAYIATLLASIAPVGATEWRGLTVSCKVIKGGYSIWGGDAEYSLLVRFENDGSESVRIQMHELYNALLTIRFQDVETGKEVASKRGHTGDVIPRSVPNEREAIVIGPDSVVNISIGLDGFKSFRPGRYKGRHTQFGLEIPEFQIGDGGEVIYAAPREQPTKPNKSE